MTQEQIERLAKHAADKYFDCLSQESKRFIVADPAAFVNDYMRVYEIAVQEVEKNQNRQEKRDELARSFK